VILYQKITKTPCFAVVTALARRFSPYKGEMMTRGKIILFKIASPLVSFGLP